MISVSGFTEQQHWSGVRSSFCVFRDFAVNSDSGISASRRSCCWQRCRPLPSHLLLLHPHISDSSSGHRERAILALLWGRSCSWGNLLLNCKGGFSVSVGWSLQVDCGGASLQTWSWWGSEPLWAACTAGTCVSWSVWPGFETAAGVLTLHHQVLLWGGELLFITETHRNRFVYGGARLPGQTSRTVMWIRGMPTQNTVKERMCGDERSLGTLRRKRPKCTANGESRVFGKLSCVTVHSEAAEQTGRGGRNSDPTKLDFSSRQSCFVSENHQ